MGRRRFNFPGYSGKYNERDGGPGGKDGKKNSFTIDGKSWEYRNPRNQKFIDQSNSNRRGPRNTVNPHSIEKFDKLYDYDFGAVRDAAKDLGIGNVDEKKEAKRIVKYLQGKRKSEPKEFKPRERRKDGPKIDIPKSPYDRNNQAPVGDNPPPGSIPYNPSRAGEEGGSSSQFDDAIASVADFGNRSTDDYFGRFLPEMEQRNKDEAEETTRNTLIALNNFRGKVPQLGDPKDLFQYYKKKIS